MRLIDSTRLVKLSLIERDKIPLNRFDACLLHQFELLVSCDLVIQKTELMRIDRMRFAAEWFSVTHRTAKQVTVGKDRH